MTLPAPSPAAPILATVVLVFLLALTVISLRLCITTALDRGVGMAPMASGEVASPEIFASTMAGYNSPRR